MEETQKVLAGIETSSNAIDAIKITLPATLISQREAARTVAGRARERLVQAERTSNATTAAEALRLAHEAADAYTQVLDQAKKVYQDDFDLRFQQAVAGATEQLSFVGNSLAELERLVAEKPGTMTPEIASRRDVLVKDHGTLQRRFDNARRSQSITGVQDAMKLAVEARTRLDELIKRIGFIVDPVPAALKQGASHYLAGQYQEALSALEPLVTQTDVPLRVHVHVFRAASLYALYVRSGETNQALRNDAFAAVQRCKEIDPAFRPDPRAFSPRFVAFFESAGSSGTQAAVPSSH
jgi:tetratricopeptide (TPR) repeat protein